MKGWRRASARGTWAGSRRFKGGRKGVNSLLILAGY